MTDDKLLAAMMRRLIAERWVRVAENAADLWGGSLAISDEEQRVIATIIEEGQCD